MAWVRELTVVDAILVDLNRAHVLHKPKADPESTNDEHLSSGQLVTGNGLFA
jgi:hypothetical protein